MMSQNFDDAIGMIPYTFKWQEVIIEAITEVGIKVGPKGVLVLISSIERSLSSNESPDLSGLSLRAASDLTAVMQLDEAELKAEINEFLDMLKGVLLCSILSSGA